MPPLPQVLPKGWKREEVVRTNGISSGVVDVVYAPSASSEAAHPTLVGKKFRTKLELHKFLGDKYDMSLLDYKSGKVSQVVWRKQRRLKSMATNMAYASKYDTYLNVPIRQTASIFKQPVNVVTNNHKNEPTPAHLNANLPNNNGTNGGKPNEKPKPVQVWQKESSLFARGRVGEAKWLGMNKVNKLNLDFIKLAEAEKQNHKYLFGSEITEKNLNLQNFLASGWSLVVKCDTLLYFRFENS